MEKGERRVLEKQLLKSQILGYNTRYDNAKSLIWINIDPQSFAIFFAMEKERRTTRFEETYAEKWNSSICLHYGLRRKAHFIIWPHQEHIKPTLHDIFSS